MGAWCVIPSTITAEMVARMKFDYVCVDAQHGLLDYETVLDMLQVIDLGDADSVVRVPSNEPAIIGKMLDAGAMGVIVPMVNSAAEAEAAVAACRYAPLGSRSFGPARVGLREGPGYFQRANAEVAVIPMIETVEALESMDEIVAAKGVDAVYVGPADLSISLGLPPGENDDDETFVQALKKILSSCDDNAVVAGIHASAARAPLRLEQGFRMVTMSMDLPSLGTAMQADLDLVRATQAAKE